MAIKIHPEAIEHLPLTQQLIIRRIFNRVSKENKNALICVTGPTGSGKSYAVLSLIIGLYLYQYGEYPPLEYVKDHSVFKSKDFLQKINNPNLRPLEAWLFDEVGVEASSKDHASNHNKALNFVVQTFRHLQQIVFFTVPSFFFMDKSVRNMVHYKLETVSINKAKKTNKCKFFILDYNERRDKLYFKYIKVLTGEYKAKVKRINTALIPKEYADQYEAQKTIYSEELRGKILTKLEKAEEKENKELNIEKKPLTERQQAVYDAFMSGLPTGTAVAKKLGLNDVQVCEAKKGFIKKGYILPK